MRTPTANPKKNSLSVKRSNGRSWQEFQRLAELGRLSASLLHEISNPLTAALLYIEQCDDKQSPGIRGARRSIRLLHRYVEAARQQVRLESRPTGFGIRIPVTQIKRLVRPLAKRAGVNLIIESPPQCRLYGDPVKFQQILANLIVNAIKAYHEDTAPDLHKAVHVSLAVGGQALTIRVTDWGQGIDAARMSRIFEPFYTTKSRSGHGLGIGLSIVKQYVTHNFRGSIRVRSSRRGGTVFIIKLPLV